VYVEFGPASAAFGMNMQQFWSRRSPMEKHLPAVAVTIGFSLLGVVGDYFLKLASANENPLKTTSFYLGFVLYASTAFGWVFVMKHLKLATIAVVYSVSMVLLLTAIGLLFFRESLSHYEIAGLVMAIASLILLVRFA
jgi:small multidrug resistance pump